MYFSEIFGYRKGTKTISYQLRASILNMKKPGGNSHFLETWKLN